MNNPTTTDPAFLDSIISNIRAQIHEHDPKLDTALEAILSLVLGRAVGQCWATNNSIPEDFENLLNEGYNRGINSVECQCPHCLARRAEINKSVSALFDRASKK